MSTATDLYTSFQNYLTVTCRIDPNPGPHVNKDEKFTLWITVFNTAPDDYPYANPRIHFKNLNATIRSSVYAKILHNNHQVESLDIKFSPQTLEPGSFSQIRVDMKAIQAVETDKVAHIQVRGDVDQNEFFLVRTFKDAPANIVSS